MEDGAWPRLTWAVFRKMVHLNRAEPNLSAFPRRDARSRHRQGVFFCFWVLILRTPILFLVPFPNQFPQPTYLHISKQIPRHIPQSVFFPELFSCGTCTPFSPSIPYEEVAVDGICAGNPTKFLKPFIDVSVSCSLVGPITSDRIMNKPKCRLLYRSDTMKFRPRAARGTRGENIRVTSRTLRRVMLAFCLLAPFSSPQTSLTNPYAFYREQILGPKSELRTLLELLPRKRLWSLTVMPLSLVLRIRRMSTFRTTCYH